MEAIISARCDGLRCGEAPLGAIDPTLPPGATATTVNGQTYFVYNDTYYKPVLVNGATGYQVVQL
jgi:hypothetical protein